MRFEFYIVHLISWFSLLLMKNAKYDRSYTHNHRIFIQTTTILYGINKIVELIVLFERLLSQ